MKALLISSLAILLTAGCDAKKRPLSPTSGVGYEVSPARESQLINGFQQLSVNALEADVRRLMGPPDFDVTTTSKSSGKESHVRILSYYIRSQSPMRAQVPNMKTDASFDIMLDPTGKVTFLISQNIEPKPGTTTVPSR